MLGRGGKTAVAEASGMSRNTVIKAEREVVEGIGAIAHALEKDFAVRIYDVGARNAGVGEEFIRCAIRV